MAAKDVFVGLKYLKEAMFRQVNNIRANSFEEIEFHNVYVMQAKPFNYLILDKMETLEMLSFKASLSSCLENKNPPEFQASPTRKKIVILISIFE